jgi:galactokinase
MQDKSQIPAQIKTTYSQLFGGQPQLLVRSPGRINIIGEHTDYNDGFVLPAAIDKAIYMAIGMRNDPEIHLYAAEFKAAHQTQLANIEKTDKEWPNYILGVVNELQQMGYTLQGFNVVIAGDLPIGAGVSSSAALENATVFALNHLLQLQITRIAMVQIAQKAEHHLAGVMCGIMDQFASMMGKKDHVIKLDCRSLDFEYVPLQLDGYSIVLFNTNVKHSLASTAYNQRRKECSEGVLMVQQHHPEIKSLRDVTEEMLDKYVLPHNKLVDQRCRFIVQEIARLQEACTDLKKGNLAGLGQKMFATHDGLSKKYEVSCKELDYLVETVRNNETVIGARMMGGGFGGCTINIIKNESIDTLINTITPRYQRDMQLPFTAHIIGIENGTGLVMEDI